MNRPVSPDEKQRYFSDARSWAQDRLASQQVSKRIAWTIAAVAASVAFVEALALIALTPLKTVVPITLLVDRHTGYVEQLKDLDSTQITADAALTQSFLVQYVIGRESFDRATIKAQYDKVALWSAQAARTDYFRVMTPNNPDNPFVLNSEGQSVEAQVKSVTPMTPTSAMVRFRTTRHDPSGSISSVENWVAAVDFKFSDKAMTVEERYANPLGFEVLSYRKSAETIAPPITYDVPLGDQSDAAASSLDQRGGE